MNDENTSIHEFDFELICEYFSSLERQGPGSIEATVKALGFIDNLTPDSRIADIGCGTGGQTITLATHTPGKITAVDLFPPFVDQLNEKAEELELSDRIHAVVGSMEELTFKPGELDLIWSEGAIYNMGFERGLHEWRRFLKQGGYVAVSEASWLTEERPEAIEQFWMEAYPGIKRISENIDILQKTGYAPVACFVLPENCWIDNFYKPQEKVQELFLEKYPENETAKAFIENERHEAALYNQYRSYYGYVFYIGKKA